MHKAVIFDLNGVFLQSEPLSSRFEKKFAVTKNLFLPALKEIMAVVRKPNAPAAFSLWKPYLDKWGVVLTGQEFFNFWFSGEHLVPELVEYAQQLRDRGAKVFILSNNFKERTEFYRKNFPLIFQSVDKAYFSWETGFVKPSIESLQLVLTENHLKPEDCIYFDDSDDNIDVAQSLGIHAEKWASLELAKAMVLKLSQE
ncbi:MAG: HAD-IA family hydrolase [Patescibacteria group bacterium]